MSEKLFDPRDPLPVDDDLYSEVLTKGGFSTSLKYGDLQKLRKVVKKVHLAHYPAHMITDREADRIIDVLAPETQQYLIKRAIDGR